MSRRSNKRLYRLEITEIMIHKCKKKGHCTVIQPLVNDIYIHVLSKSYVMFSLVLYLYPDISISVFAGNCGVLNPFATYNTQSKEFNLQFNFVPQSQHTQHLWPVAVSPPARSKLS